MILLGCELRRIRILNFRFILNFQLVATPAPHHDAIWQLSWLMLVLASLGKLLITQPVLACGFEHSWRLFLGS